MFEIYSREACKPQETGKIKYCAFCCLHRKVTSSLSVVRTWELEEMKGTRQLITDICVPAPSPHWKIKTGVAGHFLTALLIQE